MQWIDNVMSEFSEERQKKGFVPCLVKANADEVGKNLQAGMEQSRIIVSASCVSVFFGIFLLLNNY